MAQRVGTVGGVEVTRPNCGPDPSFWNGRRVFVTGHTGFKGTWLCSWLLAMGASVSGFALAPDTEPNMFEAVAMAGRVGHRIADIRNMDAVSEAIAQFCPDVIFHLAAQPLVRESYRDPIGTYATNVMGTVHLLEAARNSSSLRAIVVVSTDKCYENREWVWGYRETDRLGGSDPYSSSKACTELVTSAYRASFFPPERLCEHGVILSSVRAGNVLGGGDWSRDRLIPDAIRSFYSGSLLRVRNPDAVRPWQHVMEPLRGYLVLAQRSLQGDPAMAGPWNFGPEGSVITVGAVVEELANRWGGDVKWEATPDSDAPHETTTLQLTASKAGAELGWHPSISLSDCLDLTADWYKAYCDGASPERLYELTLRQITEHGMAP